MRRLGSLIIGAALFVCAPASAQQQFDDADAAVTALVTAAKEHHKSAINKILGPKGEKIISSGDKVADSRAREDFVAAYDKKHTISNEGEDKATLVIGDNDWPFPIPLVRKDEKWSFDTKAGLDEILRRRIGRNELSAIQVSLAYVQAQNEYASLNPDGLGPHTYAERILSSPGKKDGLYWPTAEGEEPSPLGDLAAQASAEGYRAGRQADPLSRLLLPHPQAPGRRRHGRRLRLRGQRQDDRRLRADRLSRPIRQFRHHDLHRQSGRHGVSEGFRQAHREDRAKSRDLRSGRWLAEGRRSALSERPTR